MKQNKYLIHLPHCGVEIPQKYRGDYFLSDEELNRNVFQYADYLTDELYGAFVHEFDAVINKNSRLFCDPERFFDDEFESMQQKHGLGWFYENAILEKKPLRGTQNKDEISSYYHGHHESLTSLTEQKLEAFNECTVIDCHSFSNERYWFHDKELKLPDICIGYEDFHKDERLVEAILEEFKDYDVGVNTPYAGSLVPNKFYTKDTRVKSVMIEVNKKLYLEPDNVTKSKGFDDICIKISNIKKAIIK